MRRLAWIGLAAVAAWLQAWPSPAVAEPTRAGTIATILDSDTLRLEDGREVRLTGLRVSRPADRWSQAARTLLQERTVARRVVLDPPEPATDRRGRLLAQVTTVEGLWLQGALLEAGLARVETFADNHRPGFAKWASEMLAVEAAARGDGRGLWSEQRFRVLGAAEAETAGEGFHLVEGRVVRVVERRDRFYLDFGQDWRRDFSVTILKRDRAAFKAAGLDPAELGDARLRVRGWMRMFNGPMIDATHPQQIERLP